MSQRPHDLFRQEALAARADNSAGPALRIRPVGATRLTVFFAAMAVLVILLLIFGSYTKKERVQGAIQARDGVATVVPIEAGLVQRVLVKDGQVVKAGQPLITLSHDRQTDAGSTHALLSTNLQGQRQQVQAQTEAQQRAKQAALAALDQRIAQGQRNADSVAQEIQLQSQQVASSRKLLAQLKPLLAERIATAGHHLADRRLLPDDRAAIAAQLRLWCADPAVDVVISTGGTGLTGRDVTVEAHRDVYEKEIDAFGTVFTLVSMQKIGTSAVQSRATGGVAQGTYLFALPGSPSACRDAWDEILGRQLDYRHRPCNFVEILPRLDEHLRRK